MKNNNSVKYLQDYQPSNYIINNIDLEFIIGEGYTLVKSKINIELNAMYYRKFLKGLPALALDGEDLEIIVLKLDSIQLEKSDYAYLENVLTIYKVKASFELYSEVKIYPKKNTALEGLYHSNNALITQCEAEGFRKITFFIDRPDMMSLWKVRIVADKYKYPQLLSNGNLVKSEDLPDQKHANTWVDPFRKPSYLFALVAGKLEMLESSFTTRSSREVKLQIYTEKGQENKLAHAMASLKKAMRWDEDKYNREYDLDLFMIVAVHDFNMGAMENKGLNIFNAALCLASSDTAIDTAYERIEAVIAHEYFHNWSGNRVTCRDWFQLSLKEGFTVFRDSEFTADMTSHVVKRIDDVNLLKTAQFVEDSGPMAHPVRPESYMEISNFYTLTVYEKGAELVRMIKLLIGADAFYKACDYYFSINDGTAATIEDFIEAMEIVSGKKLDKFMSWYSTAGTPILVFETKYSSNKNTYTVTATQYLAKRSNDELETPFYIPIEFALLDSSGHEMELHIKGDKKNEKNILLEMRRHKKQWVFEKVPSKPIPSILRGFSAPVIVNYSYTQEELVILASYDTDKFNRFEAMQRLFLHVIFLIIKKKNSIEEHCNILAKIIKTSLLMEDKAFLARFIALPSFDIVASFVALDYGQAITEKNTVDVDEIIQAIKKIHSYIALKCECDFHTQYQMLYTQTRQKGDSTDYKDMADRALMNCLLEYLSLTERGFTLSMKQLQGAVNMTERAFALKCLMYFDTKETMYEISKFEEKYKEDMLVMDIYFSIFASIDCKNALKNVKELTKHPAFSLNNPNKVRSLIGTFANKNHARFHEITGKGYEFLTDVVIELDQINPQIAAKMLAPMTKFKRYDKQRALLMKQQLIRIQNQKHLSSDLGEIILKTLV